MKRFILGLLLTLSATQVQAVEILNAVVEGRDLYLIVEADDCNDFGYEVLIDKECETPKMTTEQIDHCEMSLYLIETAMACESKKMKKKLVVINFDEIGLIYGAKTLGFVTHNQSFKVDLN